MWCGGVGGTAQRTHSHALVHGHTWVGGPRGAVLHQGGTGEGVGPAHNYTTLAHSLACSSYGSVYQAIHLPTGKEVALKVLKLDIATDIKELRAEISLLSKINCSNIVQFYGSYIKNKSLWVKSTLNRISSSIQISMEYCDAGSALDILIQLKKPFTEIQIKSVLIQAAEGLNYLHSMSPPIIHRDIKVRQQIRSLILPVW